LIKPITLDTEYFGGMLNNIPTGLESLPLPWLKALPGLLWSLRQPHWTHVPYMLCEVFVSAGLLQLRFAQEPKRQAEDPQVSGFDRVRQAVNLRLYPSCYRALKRRHACRLKRPRSDLSLEP
jgi:hypothetical protein